MTTVLSPRLAVWRTIVAPEDGSSVRDPSAPLFSAADGHWHFWATHIEGSRIGYLGRVWHYYARDIAGPWNTTGVAVPPSGGCTAFDAFSTFTPTALFDPEESVWWLFYGGIVDNSSAHRESIGLASSSSPFGPFVKHQIGRAHV